MEQSGKLFHKKFCLFIISFFGTGLISKKMPGTVGSIFATVLALFLSRSPKLLISLAIVLFIIGTILCQIYITKYEANKDPGYAVIDEVCGIFLGCGIIYLFGFCSQLAIFLNFLFFRLFDIWKPFPIKNVEKFFKNNDKTLGFGIMIDDVLAGIFAAIINYLVLKSL